MSERRAGRGPGPGRRIERLIRGASRLLLFVVPLAACEHSVDALVRGDRLWADSAYEEALAEYRLASSRAGEDALPRLAHAYAAAGELERAQETYDELIEQDPDYADQAVFDFLAMAERAHERGDEYGMTRAVEAALRLRPNVELGALSGAVANYYSENASSAQALTYLERSLSTASPDSAARLMFRIGRLRAENGQCPAAIPYLRSYLSRVSDGTEAGQARWTIGNCAFQAARTAHQDGNLTGALESLETVLELGVPANLQDQAWFLRGEIQYALGKGDEAIESYRRVIELNPERSGQLVERAQMQIERIRFSTPAADPADPADRADRADRADPDRVF